MQSILTTAAWVVVLFFWFFEKKEYAMYIGYSEEKGKLWYEYADNHKLEEGSGSQFVSFMGVVPEEIFPRGAEAVREFVKNEVARKLEELKGERAAYRASASNLNIPVSTTHDGVMLEGKIIDLYRGVAVRLEKPAEYAGETYVYSGWASAMHDQHVLKGDPEAIMQDRIACAQGLLVDIYKKNLRRKIHPNVHALLDELKPKRDP